MRVEMSRRRADFADSKDEKRRNSRDWDNQEGDADLDPGWISQIQDNLDTWFAGAKRDLPWRADRDPYRILVSEMMLIQTTAAAVGPYFERFLARFPDVGALAAAEEVEVLKAWEGLGYYRRARQLHAAARIIVAEHGGRVPDVAGQVRSLPGVGRYIAGAILSQAFDHPEPILEANSRRVLARLIAWRGAADSTATLKRLWDCAGRLVPKRGAGDFNQGLMELGALICTPRNPSCLICPVRAQCQARRAGLQDVIPTLVPRATPLAVVETAVVARRAGQFLVVRRGTGRLWEDFWEFPTFHRDGTNPGARLVRDGTPSALADGFAQATGLKVDVGPEWKRFKYSVTKHRVTLHVHQAGNPHGILVPGPGLDDVRWVDAEAIANLPVTAPARRIAAAILKAGMDGGQEN
jgi:A/G-specific adenine glycosylase